MGGNIEPRSSYIHITIKILLDALLILEIVINNNSKRNIIIIITLCANAMKIHNKILSFTKATPKKLNYNNLYNRTPVSKLINPIQKYLDATLKYKKFFKQYELFSRTLFKMVE